MKLEDFKKDVVVSGILPNKSVTVVDVKWHGEVVELFYKADDGSTGNELLYRFREADLELVSQGARWSFDGDGDMLRLVSEAHRIRLAYLFDPFLAVTTSLVEPLPHQITAVYGEMLPRQPLRFLLADDPGAGKTIMAGLFIRELLIRGDLEKCLIVCPGNLAEQWQDELYDKFHVRFDIITRDKIESSPTGNPFLEIDHAIGRIDHLSRNEELQEKLKQSDWDLIICDEAHKMSASFFGNEAKYTKRYRLGQLLSTLTRHFLLMTATPHNGKEADFQLFMALLDSDQFEGRYREGDHRHEYSDLMRRMIKEKLVKFDGTPLFPERKAYTVDYALSADEAALYADVTNYVRDEFNRAEKLESDGRRGTVGFALTILQRRLASSPEAIFQSIHRRRKRLEKRLKEEELLRRGANVTLTWDDDLPDFTSDDWDDFDDAPDEEVEAQEDEVIDRATAARTIEELRAEIETLKTLENQANQVLRGGKDKKWEELSKLLHDEPEMFDSNGSRRKLVIFTEHKDTLNYLEHRITTLTGRPESVVVIHGGVVREKRREAAARFTQDSDVHILIATDAAGEGINLQRAHLMVNYDLPWNPNRLEQRFGRIHRIGQTEVCHLWNLVAGETREGAVMERLFRKIEQESQALQGQVFDVLGKAFGDVPLRELLIEAIRYGDRPEVKAKLSQKIEHALDHHRLTELLEENALVHDVMDDTKLRRIREDMERAQARKLQPHFIQSFFIEAFTQLGGAIRERESKRYEIKHVPATIRNRDRQIGTRDKVLQKYERITFEKELINAPPKAEFVCPGHSLLNAVIDLTMERHGHLLKKGAILVDGNDPSQNVRILYYLEHSIFDARMEKSGRRRCISKRLQFVEIDQDGNARHAGYAPYLDYRKITEDEFELIENKLSSWIQKTDVEKQAMSYAIQQLVPEHLNETKNRIEERIDRTIIAVQDRLSKEIRLWDNKAIELKKQEKAGKINARLNSQMAQRRADNLQSRLQKRLEELKQERQISAQAPVVVGGALIVPAGLLNELKNKDAAEPDLFAHEKKRIELIAMNAVLQMERSLGNRPRDISADKVGYDIESSDGTNNHLRFIEVKGRIKSGKTVTITKTEILTGFNKPDQFILAIVLVPESDELLEKDDHIFEKKVKNNKMDGCEIYYISEPFDREPGFAEHSINYSIKELLQRGKRM